jgi:hypothetical protein
MRRVGQKRHTATQPDDHKLQQHGDQQQAQRHPDRPNPDLVIEKGLVRAQATVIMAMIVAMKEGA